MDQLRALQKTYECLNSKVGPVNLTEEEVCIIQEIVDDGEAIILKYMIGERHAEFPVPAIILKKDDVQECTVSSRDIDIDASQSIVECGATTLITNSNGRHMGTKTTTNKIAVVDNISADEGDISPNNCSSNVSLSHLATTDGVDSPISIATTSAGLSSGLPLKINTQDSITGSLLFYELEVILISSSIQI